MTSPNDEINESSFDPTPEDNTVSAGELSTFKESSAPVQLALKIFDDLKVSGMAIHESPVDIGFKKNNLFIDVVDLGVSARRALNAFMYIASTSEAIEGDMYSVDIEYFKWLTNAETSNNLSHMKRAVRETQKSAVQINIIDSVDPSKDAWASVPMVGTAVIANGKVQFSFPSIIENRLRDPKSYTYISLRISSKFTSNYTTNMYERLLQLRFRGGTDWMSFEDARIFLGVDKVKSYEVFKEFKRNVIVKSIDAINELSDIFVTFETKSTDNSKRVTYMRFLVKDNPLGKLNLKRSFEDDIKELYDILTKEFGLNEGNLNEIMSDRVKYSDDRLREVIDFVRARLSGDHNIKFPGLYFMKALKDDLRLSMAELKSMERNGFKSLKKESDNVAGDAAKKAKKLKDDNAKKTTQLLKEEMEAKFRALSTKEQKKIYSDVIEESKNNAVLIRNIKNFGMDNSIVRNAVCKHLIKLQQDEEF